MSIWAEGIVFADVHEYYDRMQHIVVSWCLNIWGVMPLSMHFFKGTAEDEVLCKIMTQRSRCAI